MLPNLAGVSAFSTLAGFNVCTYAGAPAGGTESDMRRLEQLLGVPRERIHLPLQTHSDRIAIVGSYSENPVSADGVVARGRGIAVGVHTADCLPLLMVDPAARVIAAVHCGWRGTVAGIATNAVRAMASLGADPAHIVAAFGPHICPDCFEVGPEVADQFPAEAVRPASGGGKPHVDLAAAVALQLRRAGVCTIQPCPHCSKTSPDLYSVRRQGPALTARTLSLIIVN